VAGRRRAEAAGIKVPDQRKTKAQLIQDLTGLRSRVAELEQRAPDREELDRDKIEAALERSEATWQALLSALPDMGMLLDNRGRILAVNETACLRLGLTAQELVGRLAGDLSPRGLGAKAREMAIQVITTGRGIRRDLEADGLIQDTGIFPILEPDGSVGRLAFFSRNVNQRRQAEADLLLSQATLDSIHQAAPIGIGLVVGPERILDWTNERLSKMTGYAISEMKGMPARRLCESEAEYQRVSRVIDAAVGRRGAGSVETRWRRKDGRVFDLLLSSAPLSDDPGDGLVLTALDMSEHKRAEKALRESEQNYRQIFDATGEAIFIVNAESGRILDVNQSALDMFGYDRGRLLDASVNDLSLGRPPYSRREAAAIFRRVRQEGTQTVEWLSRRKGGQLFWTEINYKAVTIGGRGRILVVIRDITSRKRAEHELQRLATAIEHAAEDIFITDALGTIEYVNPAFERLTGFSRAEVVGQNPRLLKSGRHDRRFYERMWETITHGRIWTGRITNRRRDGTLIEQEATISPIVDAVDQITGFVSVKRDVTDQLRLEAQLVQSQKMEAIGRLAGGVAHDFNNVLAVIVAYSELLLESLDHSDPLRDDLEQISQAGQRGAALTDQLLAFSRRKLLEPRVVDLGEVVRNMEKMLVRVIGEDIELITALEPKLGSVFVDPVQMEQVVLNLVVNARDAMPDGGSLTIETHNLDSAGGALDLPLGGDPGPCVVLSVSDTGDGMDRETQSHIFEPFYSTKEASDGTGLGLATVFGIVKQSGGHIEVNSEPGQGSVFRIYLPRSDRARSQPREVIPEEDLPRGTETILLLEDDRGVRRAAARILRKHGYSVLEASNAGEGLMISEGHSGSIHLLLTDVVLPKISGVQFAQRLTAARNETKVLYMSGYTDEAVSVHGLSLDGLNFLAKPFTPRALVQKVSRILSQKG
jgi:PAS domain S-box-containing protein